MVLPISQILLGSPVSNTHQPNPVELAQYLQALFLNLTGANAGALIQTSKSALDGLSPAANTMAWVIGDANPDLDGVYQRSGSSWVKRGPLPYSVIQLNNADEGTANAIQVTTAVGIPSAAFGALYILNVTQENTGPVTVSINGDAPKPVVSNTGAPLPAGTLQPPMGLLALDDGTNLRLFVYGNVEAILAGAESQAERAEDARDAADAFASDALESKNAAEAAVGAQLGDGLMQDLRIGDYANSLRPVPQRWRHPRIVADNANYKMAPFSHMIGEVMIILYSDGGTHGNTDRQIMGRKDGLRGAWQFVTFYENATEVFDFSLLEPLMAVGDIVTLKSFTVVKLEDGCHATINSIITSWENALLHSDDSDNAAWTKVNFDAFGAGSIANTTEVRAPDGSQTANFLRPTSGASTRTLQQQINGFSPNQNVIFARWFKHKPGGPQWIRLFAFDADDGANYVTAFFDILNGVIGTISNLGNASAAAAEIYPGGNGWYLCVLRGKPNTSGSNVIVTERPTNNGTSSNSYTADGVGGYYSWRAALIATTTLPSRVLLRTTTAAVSTGITASHSYAYWSRIKSFAEYPGAHYRTAYTTTPADWVSALFKSTDRGYSWVRHATLGSGAGLDLNEADIEVLDNGDFVALIREDAGAGRPLYFNRSVASDDGWLTAVAIDADDYDGTQPWLGKANDNRILAAAGDRVGTSGLNSDGSVNYIAANRVGTSIAIAPADWASRTEIKRVGMLGLSFGTDCGQPMGERESDGSYTFVDYLTKDGANSPAFPNIYARNVVTAELL